MTEEERVRLCPLRMQECRRGAEACPHQPVAMGEDAGLVVEAAECCEYAGLDLPAYYYRGLAGAERKRHGAVLSRRVLEGGVGDAQAEIA